VADAPLSVESAISAATGADEPSASADPIVTEPLTSAPAESSFDDIAKLFTSAAPSAPAPSAPAPSAGEDKLDLIHEGEDVLSGTQGRPEEPPLLGAHDEARAREAPRQADAAATSPAEAAPPSFALPFLEGLTSPEAAAAPPPAAEPPQPAEVEPTAARSSAPDASTAFVTETMAELYVKQGHHEQAIEVYRQLVQLHPNDSALAARLRSLERGGTPAEQPAAMTAAAADAVAEAGPTIREFLGSIAGFQLRSGDVASDHSAAPAANGAVETPNETRAPASGARTVGGSLSELFSGAEQDVSRQAPAPVADVGVAEALIAAQEGAAADTKPLSGRPSKPAATELSLDHVFRHATPAAGSSAHSSFSFDQFFSEQAQQDVTASEHASGSEESGGLSDDIQQFNAWLEGLKKS
jgi:tetratricopeptide repeat protein